MRIAPMGFFIFFAKFVQFSPNSGARDFSRGSLTRPLEIRHLAFRILHLGLGGTETVAYVLGGICDGRTRQTD